MQFEDLQKYSEQNGIMKITGPPCDWLKTLNTFSWGFRRYERTEKAWKAFKKFDVFVFHSMKQEYLPDVGLPTGIIGIGLMSKKEIIENEPFDEAFTPEGLRPLKIYFSDMWLFGDIADITDEPISAKKERGMSTIVKDLADLTDNAISFSTLKLNNCLISTQGAVSMISHEKAGNLMKLISEKVSEPHLTNYSFMEE
jgi:hypothetical protein